MDFALTTRWNAGRHASGEAMIEEILEMGFQHLELGYDLRIDQVPGVQKMVEEGAVEVVSLHNICPIPIGAPMGHPELFTLASKDRKVRDAAVQYTAKTLRLASDLGAKAIVTHAGNVEMRRGSGDLADLFERGQQFSAQYDKKKLKVQITREKKVRKHLEYLYQGLEQLLPVLHETGVKLGIENLPSWESIPTEVEAEEIFKRFGDEHIGLWHDIGHGRIRQNLGFINQERWLDRLSDHLVGMHVHDVAPPVFDHLMPPRGDIDFHTLRRFANLPVLRVIEPTPRTSREDIVEGLRYLREVWAQDEALADG